MAGKPPKHKDDDGKKKRPYIAPALIAHASILFTTTDVGAMIT